MLLYDGLWVQVPGVVAGATDGYTIAKVPTVYFLVLWVAVGGLAKTEV